MSITGIQALTLQVNMLKASKIILAKENQELQTDLQLTSNLLERIVDSYQSIAECAQTRNEVRRFIADLRRKWDIQ